MSRLVQDGGGHGGVAQVFAPVLHHSVGADDDGAAQFVALVNDGLGIEGTQINFKCSFESTRAI
jgi:hypothetical protein